MLRTSRVRARPALRRAAQEVAATMDACILAKGKASTPAGNSRRERVRIIGGEYRGRRIAVPDRPGLRPTPDRVRETLFNWLGQRLDGLACLDLFAGSGALGFEAASRGAARVVMVENDRAAFGALEETARRDRCGAVELIYGDAFDYLARGEDVSTWFSSIRRSGRMRCRRCSSSCRAGSRRDARVYVEARRAARAGRRLARAQARARRAGKLPTAGVERAMIKAVYPGTFDPLTRGHEDLVRRASRAVRQRWCSASPTASAKRTFFTLEERIAMAREVLGDVKNVERRRLQQPADRVRARKQARASCCAACARCPTSSTSSSSPA